MPLKLKTCYTLTVHFYPDAVKYNVKPTQHSYHGDPALYQSRQFIFDHPPTPDDFRELVEMLPWAKSAWKKKLIPLLEFNNWPYVLFAKTGNKTDIYMNDHGVIKKVGHLVIQKEDIYGNEEYPKELCVTRTLTTKLIKKYPADTKGEIRNHIEQSELRIIGNVIKSCKIAGTRPTTQDIENEVKKIIQEWLNHKDNKGD